MARILCYKHTRKIFFVQNTLIMTKQTQTKAKTEKFPDEVTTTVKVKLLPNKDQERLLSDTLTQYLKACNFVSEKVCELRKHNYKEVQKVIYHNELKQFGLKSNVSISVLRTVDSKYKQKEDRIKKKKNLAETQRRDLLYNKPVVFKVPECDLVRSNDYSLLKDVFSIYAYTPNQKSNSRNRIKMAYEHKYVDSFLCDPKYKLGTAKLKQVGKNFYLFVPITKKVEPFKKEVTNNIVGIDRGIRFTATSYDSEGKMTFFHGGKIIARRVHFKNKRAELQRKGTPSARRRIKAMGHRENRWMRDVNHCVSKALVEKSPANTLFVIEDLTNVRKSTQRVKKERKYTQVSWSYYDLEAKLKYKALLKGSYVINVPANYTSQRCPVCGHIQDTNRDKEKHCFCCRTCGYRSNDDRIGAMNLFLMGKHWNANPALVSNEIRLTKDGNKFPVFGAKSRVPRCDAPARPNGQAEKGRRLEKVVCTTGQLQVLCQSHETLRTP